MGGERRTSNKIFCFNLEKRNCNKSTICELKIYDHSILKDESRILQKIGSFYQNLYTKNISFLQADYDEFCKTLQIPLLSEEESEKCERRLTYEECKMSLKSFQTEKSAGEDGFTVKFYKFFF